MRPIWRLSSHDGCRSGNPFFTQLSSLSWDSFCRKGQQILRIGLIRLYYAAAHIIVLEHYAEVSWDEVSKIGLTRLYMPHPFIVLSGYLANYWGRGVLKIGHLDHLLPFSLYFTTLKYNLLFGDDTAISAAAHQLTRDSYILLYQL